MKCDLRGQEKTIGNTAIIGAGPAGLTCAWYLAQHGQKAVIFEKLPIAGGVPSTVIPSFRISREDIASDIDKLEKLSVEFRFGTEISTIEACEALKEMNSIPSSLLMEHTMLAIWCWMEMA